MRRQTVGDFFDITDEKLIFTREIEYEAVQNHGTYIFGTLYDPDDIAIAEVAWGSELGLKQRLV